MCVCVWGGGGGGGRSLRHLYRGRQFRSQIYFYYTNRGANIYIWLRAAIPPAPPLHHIIYGSLGMSATICSTVQTPLVLEEIGKKNMYYVVSVDLILFIVIKK